MKYQTNEPMNDNDKWQDLFFDDFAKVFAKLIELGVHRSERPYAAADKKADVLGAPGQGKSLKSSKL